MGDIDLDRIIADLQDKRARLARWIAETGGTAQQRDELRNEGNELAQLEAERREGETLGVERRSEK